MMNQDQRVNNNKIRKVVNALIQGDEQLCEQISSIVLNNVKSLTDKSFTLPWRVKRLSYKSSLHRDILEAVKQYLQINDTYKYPQINHIKNWITPIVINFNWVTDKYMITRKPHFTVEYHKTIESKMQQILDEDKQLRKSAYERGEAICEGYDVDIYNWSI